jgi:S-adenosylmethionine hydrolase
MSRPIVTLLTDFGQADSYVGTMKGVMLGICPEATLVDLSHQVHAQAVQQAAYLLSTAAPYFPPGTVHLVVVDPGVGGDRRAVVVQAERAVYVAPDNGVLGMALAGDPGRVAIHLSDPHYRLPAVSATFHGRDIFAPAAAYLARGTDPHQLGPPINISDLVTLPRLQPTVQPDGTYVGQVLHVDRFGNLVTNHHAPAVKGQVFVSIGGERIAGLNRTFSGVAPGELVAYVGSSGYLEIAVRNGNAAARLGLDVGAPVRIQGLVPDNVQTDR